MEKVIFPNKNRKGLSGIFHESTNGYYILFVHGFAGNKDEKGSSDKTGLFQEAAEFFAQEGYGSLRFDLEGCGESEGDFINASLISQVDDLMSAMNYLKGRTGVTDEKIIPLGFSLGATLIILGSASNRELRDVKASVFWSPAFFPARDMYPRYQTPANIISFKDDGYILKSGLKVSESYIEELSYCNIVPHMQYVRFSALIVHGEKDDKISPVSSLCGSKNFPDATVRLIKDADHSFRTPATARQKLFSSTLDFLHDAN